MLTCPGTANVAGGYPWLCGGTEFFGSPTGAKLACNGYQYRDRGPVVIGSRWWVTSKHILCAGTYLACVFVGVWL